MPVASEIIVFRYILRDISSVHVFSCTVGRMQEILKTVRELMNPSRMGGTEMCEQH